MYSPPFNDRDHSRGDIDALSLGEISEWTTAVRTFGHPKMGRFFQSRTFRHSRPSLIASLFLKYIRRCTGQPLRHVNCFRQKCLALNRHIPTERQNTAEKEGRADRSPAGFELGRSRITPWDKHIPWHAAPVASVRSTQARCDRRYTKAHEHFALSAAVRDGSFAYDHRAQCLISGLREHNYRA